MVTDASASGEEFTETAGAGSETPIIDAVVAHIPGVSRELQQEAKEAEERAAKIMRDIGFSDAKRSRTGPDRGVDVTATGAIAQVKWHSKQIPRTTTQEFAGAWLHRQRTWKRNEKMFFFSKGGYSRFATQYADDIGMVLFVFTKGGKITPANKHARAYQKKYPSVVAKAQSPSRPTKESPWRNVFENVLTLFLTVVLPLAMLAVGVFLTYVGIDRLLSGSTAAGIASLVGGLLLFSLLVAAGWWVFRSEK